MKPKNLQAVEDWVRKHRPDLIGHMPMLQENQGVWLLVSIGFEAGRQFQNDNPRLPLNDPSHY
jgi:hypothetical protein